MRRIASFLAVCLILPLLVQSGQAPAQAKTPISQSTTFSAGSYIIDMGVNTLVMPAGLQPYGLLYKLLTSLHVPVSWVIADGKAGGYASPATGLVPATVDFTASVIRRGAGTAAVTPVVTQSYTTGAFVIAKEYVNAAVDAAVLSFPLLYVDKATASFTAPVYDTLAYWPKAVLDSQNGNLAQAYYINAGIPNATSAYIWKSPSQLDPCDDIYVMPHADPTWATHSNLKPFNAQGAFIYASCHAVSVLENLVNPLNASDRMNLLSVDGLVLFGNHSGGTPPYNYNTDGSDPILQVGGPIDAAVQNGSEQIFVSQPAGWRSSTLNLAWDATQANVPVGSENARTLTYGRGFGVATNGLVMYEAGHSLDKGTIGDVPAQRAFFNFLLLGGIERSPKVAVTKPASPILSGSSTTVNATVTGGSAGYNYTWASTCAGATFTPSTGYRSTIGPVQTTFTAPNVTDTTTCGIQLLVNDDCGRQPFGATSIDVTPAADLSIKKSVGQPTVGVNAIFAYTLTVTNNGPGTAKAPQVTDTLSPATDAAYVSASPGPTSNTGGKPTWTLADLAPGGTATITLSMRALAAGATLTNTAVVSSVTPDNNLANNTSSAINRVLNAGIRIEKLARPEFVPPAGGPVTFEFVVHNAGSDPLSNVVVTDNPACTTISGPTGDLNNDGILAAPFNGVETEIWRYTCTRTVTTATADVAVSSPGGYSAGVPPVDSSIYTKQDVVQSTANDPLGNQVRAIASTVVTVSNPSISVTKTLNPSTQQPSDGSSATFDVTVTNTGNATLSNVSTADIWTPGSCSTSAIGTLAPGAVYAMTCSATLPASKILYESFDQATTWPAGWTAAGGNPLPAVVPASIDLPAGYSPSNVLMFTHNTTSARTTVDLSNSPNGVNISFVYYRTAGFNSDSNAAHNLTLSIGGTTQITVSSTSSAGGASTADAGWQTATVRLSTASLLTAGQSLVITENATDQTVYVDSIWIAKGQVNTVTATGYGPSGTQVTSTASSGTVWPGPPGLNITKTSSAASIGSGGSFIYTVTVTNNSTVTQTGINVADTLPAGLTLNGPVTAAKPAYSLTAADGFATSRLYSTGTGWAGDWTEMTESDGPTAGKLQVLNNQGNPASSLLIDSSILTRIQRKVNLGGAASATLEFQCMREAGNSADDTIAVYVSSSTDPFNATPLISPLWTNGQTTTAECPVGVFGTITKSIPVSALLNGSILDVRATGDKKFWLDNVKITANWAATSATPAGSPPVLTSAGGPYVIPANASVTFTVPVRVSGAPTDGNEFSNRAQVTSTQRPDPVSSSAVTRYLSPSFTITKTAIETWVNASGPVTYRIEVRNTGNVALTPTVTDPSCNAAPVYVQGDLNTDGLLEVGEIWRYTCPRTVSTANSHAVPDLVVNTAKASMTDVFGNVVPAQTASANVSVIHPVISVTVTPVTSVIAPGAAVAYAYTLSNRGDIGLANPTPSAANCSPLVYQGGDTNGNAVLDVSENWSYTCTTSAITANQLNQQVSATAKDPIFASTVTDAKTVAVYVTPPLVITKSATDATSGASGVSIQVGPQNSITYHYTLTSPAATPAVGLPLSAVTVTDDKCSPVNPDRIGANVSGDTNTNGTLDPGETWQFSCSGGNLAAATTNTASASATFSTGGVTGSVGSGLAKATVTILKPLLLLGKAADTVVVRVGGSATFTLTVWNAGATSFALGSLGAPSDKVVDASGAITATDACSAVSGPSFPKDATHDANGNALLDPGEQLSYSCTTTLTVDTLDAFGLATSTDTLGSTYIPVPATARVFVINPAFTVTKVATATDHNGKSATGTSIDGQAGQPVTYTFTIKHTITTAYGDFRDGLNALKLTVSDPRCDVGTLKYVSGDTDTNALLNPGETWTYTCSLASLAADAPTVNTVTVVAAVVERTLNPGGTPAAPNDGLGPITLTASATVTPFSVAVTLLKRGVNCDVGVPTCVSTFAGSAFTLYTSDPTQPGAGTGVALTNSSGTATFVTQQLPVNRDYWIVESRAPAGFQLLAQPIRFRLTNSALTLDPAGASSLITADPANYTITVTDVAAAILPKVGGDGTLPYLGIGLLLMLGAGAYAWTTPRQARARRAPM